MSLTVRYPNGTSVDYNTAVKMTYRSDGVFELLDGNGNWIASIQGSSGAIVERYWPCVIRDGLDSAARRFADNPERLRDVDWNVLADIKRALRSFHIQRGWQD